MRRGTVHTQEISAFARSTVRDRCVPGWDAKCIFAQCRSDIAVDQFHAHILGSLWNAMPMNAPWQLQTHVGATAVLAFNLGGIISTYNACTRPLSVTMDEEAADEDDGRRRTRVTMPD